MQFLAFLQSLPNLIHLLKDNTKFEHFCFYPIFAQDHSSILLFAWNGFAKEIK